MPVCLMGLLQNWDLLAAHVTGEGIWPHTLHDGDGDGADHGPWVSSGAWVDG